MNELGIRTVIVPIDDSDGAERALPHAQFLATRLDAKIQLLAVADTPERGQHLQHALDHAHAQLVGELGDTRVAYDFWTAEHIVAATTPDHAVACTATSWADALGLPVTLLESRDAPVAQPGTERQQVVTMIAATVPAGWGRRLSPSARAASRLIRAAHAPVLAVPHR